MPAGRQPSLGHRERSTYPSNIQPSGYYNAFLAGILREYLNQRRLPSLVLIQLQPIMPDP